MIADSLNLFTLKETLACGLLEEIEWKRLTKHRED